MKHKAQKEKYIIIMNNNNKKINSKEHERLFVSILSNRTLTKKMKKIYKKIKMKTRVREKKSKKEKESI